jgi:nickel-dependent lactate racemase
MKRVHVPLGPSGFHLDLPEATDVYAMSAPETLTDPARAVRAALASPIASKPLAEIARGKADAARSGKRAAKACILVSDNTRPVPYTGEQGILVPVVETLMAEGFAASDILVLVATGMHRFMRDEELKAMIDPRIFALGIEVANHDGKDEAGLVRIGTSTRGGEMHVNRRYVEADLKITTGLVESHFMAGASGGRKSVCPGIIGEKSTFVFHGAPFMAHPEARDLNLAGNPVHEESLEFAKKAGVDFIVNVTLNHSFKLTGVFAGDLEKAHEAAVAKVKSYVGIPVRGEYDIVVSHAGFVGINHYQVAKVGVASLGALKKGGHLIIVGDNKDSGDAIGSMQYRMTLQLLKLIGPEAFTRVIMSKDWTFIPEQWQTQMWTKLFNRIPLDHFHYFAPQLDDRHWKDLPGVDGRRYLTAERRAAPRLSDAQAFVDGALAAAFASFPEAERGKLRIAYLSDGPYGIPYQA